jgi:hypothetical protein
MATYYLLSRVLFTTWLLHLGQLVRNDPKLLAYNKSKQDHIEAFMAAQLFILIPVFGELIGIGIFFLIFHYLERFFTWWLSS